MYLHLPLFRLQDHLSAKTSVVITENYVVTEQKKEEPPVDWITTETAVVEERSAEL